MVATLLLADTRTHAVSAGTYASATCIADSPRRRRRVSLVSAECGALRVVACLASSAQQMSSLRAKGVMPFQTSSAVVLAISALRRSAGSLCTTPPDTLWPLTRPRSPSARGDAVPPYGAAAGRPRFAANGHSDNEPGQSRCAQSAYVAGTGFVISQARPLASASPNEGIRAEEVRVLGDEPSTEHLQLGLVEDDRSWSQLHGPPALGQSDLAGSDVWTCASSRPK